MNSEIAKDTISLDMDKPIWDRFFQLAQLVLIGTTNSQGLPDMAPKHLVCPMGWENYFGFVCTPSHTTYQNIIRSGEFSVTFLRPSQLLYASLAASPRCEEDQSKAVLDAFNTFDAQSIDALFLEDGYAFLECKHHKTVDGFGKNSLITGVVVAAHIHTDALRVSDKDDTELIRKSPLLAYISPWRFASVSESNAFPLPDKMKR